MGQTTITVKEQTLERFRSLKSELDDSQPHVPDHTNDLFLQSLLDTWEAADDGYYDTDAEEIAEQLEQRIDSSAFNGGITDNKADDMIREIRKLQELVEQAPERTADEVERKFQ